MEILESSPAGSYDVDVDEDGKMFIVEDLDYVGVEVHSDKSDKIAGAKGLKLSLNFIFKFNSFCIFSDLGSANIDLPPNALGPNSILP